MLRIASDLVVLAMIWAQHQQADAVVLPVPGGPQRMIEGNMQSASMARAQCDATHRRLPGPRMVLGATALR